MLAQSSHEDNSIPRFLAGDIILCPSNNDLPGALTRWIEQSSGENPTYAVHTAQFLDPATILEMEYTVKKRTLKEVLQKRKRFEVWRCPSLTMQQREAISLKSLDYFNARFGWAKVITHSLDGLLNKVSRKQVFFFRRLNHSDRYPICSWVTAFSYDRVLHYQFGVPPECADPDQIHDWLKTHPGEWTRVFCMEEYLQKRARPARAAALRHRPGAGEFSHYTTMLVTLPVGI